MKRKLAIIVIAVLLIGFCCAFGFGYAPELTQNLNSNKEITSAKMDVKENELQSLAEDDKNAEAKTDEYSDTVNSNKEITGTKTAVKENELQPLTDDDKKVKAKIAEYSDTVVDFRQKKQENIQGKNYDISFVKFNSNEDPNKIIYENSLGDSFEYDIETGKLCNITLESNVVEKTVDSIDIDAAHKIALEYFPKDCNINEYTNDMSRECDDGYIFYYTRYVGKYMTTDAFRIVIGFDGSIVDINDATDVFEGKNINFDESYVDEKIAEYTQGKDDLELGMVVILQNEGKICADCSFEQSLSNGAVSAYRLTIPLE